MFQSFQLLAFVLIVGGFWHLPNCEATFQDDAIFDDEDIYSQALPPIPNTGITAPGTKWCGPGNSSSSYDDLGTQRATDICCRAHDHCPNIIEPRSSYRSLTNNDWFPILKCPCEQELLNCLQNVNTLVSNTIGRAYFGTRTRCFAEAHPIVECIEYQDSTFFRRCIRYKFNKSKPKIWQYFDIPYYSISSATFQNKIKKQI